MYLICNTNETKFIYYEKGIIKHSQKKEMAQKFELGKAKNLFDNLPKTLDFADDWKIVEEDSKSITIQLENIPNENAMKILQDFKTYQETIKVRHSYLYGELSICDKKIGDIEHGIENLDLPAHKTSLMAKEMKSILKYRREIKEELSVLKQIMDLIYKKEVQINMNKVYSLRTDILNKYLK